MSERQANRNRKILRNTALAVATALAAPALAACTGAPSNPTPPATASEDPAVKAEREQREQFLKKFDAVAAPVEVIANPLVVTHEAKERERVLFAIDEDNLSLAWGDTRAAVKKAKRAIENATDPDVRHDGRVYLNQALAESAVNAAASDIYVYDGSKRLRRENAQTVTAIREQIGLISSDELKATATDLVNRELVDEALDDEDGKLSETEKALLERVPKGLKTKALNMLKDKTGKSYETFSEALRTDEEKFDAHNEGFNSLYDGAAWRADEINKAMEAQLKDRKAHSADSKRPGAKDIVMEAVDFTDVEDARIQRGNLLAIPEEFAEVKQEALRAFDGELLSTIGITLEYASSLSTAEQARATLDEIKAYLDLFVDDKTKKLAEEYVEVQLAVLYTLLDDEYNPEGKEDEKARDQLVLSQLPDSSKAKQEALKIRGGKTDISKLSAIEEKVSDPVYQIIQRTDEVLVTGSNAHAEGINVQVADYLKANND